MGNSLDFPLPLLYHNLSMEEQTVILFGERPGDALAVYFDYMSVSLYKTKEVDMKQEFFFTLPVEFLCMHHKTTSAVVCPLLPKVRVSDFFL